MSCQIVKTLLEGAEYQVNILRDFLKQYQDALMAEGMIPTNVDNLKPTEVMDLAKQLVLIVEAVEYPDGHQVNHT